MPHSAESAEDVVEAGVEVQDDPEVKAEVETNEESLALKTAGNEAFRSSDFRKAIELFSSAIAVDKANAILYTNRAMCYGALKEWPRCIHDGKRAVQLNPQHAKAHFWIVRGLAEQQQVREARQYLLVAFKDCGAASESNAQFKQLEEELGRLGGAPLRPRPSDFETLEELGDGNFSKIYKAKLKASGAVYAIKTIEVATVERMKRRHRNIHNELLMEKRALSRLNHPGVVTLYATFKDYGSLYYQMEFLPGGELWSWLQEKDDSGDNDGTFGLSNSVGLHLSQARFVMAEALNALEYMHNQGIVHRDVKPENMLFTAAGHLKFVDFGTAKDLVQTDLNGPEFVGTPEYMSPSTVGSKTVGPEGDLWAMGVVLYQMLVGYTPFAAPSPYLGFLRTKRGLLKLPTFVSDHETQLLTALLTKDPQLRLAQCCSASPARAPGAAPMPPQGPINYDPLRRLPFFSAQEHRLHLLGPEAAPDDTLPSLRCMHERDAVRVPKLSELCRRAVGRASATVARLIAQHGGARPDTDTYPALAWVSAFSLAKCCSDADWRAGAVSKHCVTSADRQYIIHYLTRRQQINNPGLYRLFWRSVVDTKCIRSDFCGREYLGYNRNTQGIWKSAGIDAKADRSGPGGKDHGVSGVIQEFTFAHFGAAAFGGSSGEAADVETDAGALKSLVTSINRLRPKFVVMSGNFTRSYFAEADASYAAQLQAFRKTAARVSDTIPVMFLPGEKEMGLANDAADAGAAITQAAIEAYHASFGLDFYGFWFNGIRCLLLNSSLFFCPAPDADADANADENAMEQDAATGFVSAHIAWQEQWLAEEIDMAKLASTQLLVFTAHPWFITEINEEDGARDAQGLRAIPKQARLKWLARLQHARASLVLSQGGGAGAEEGGAKKGKEKKSFCFPDAPEEALRKKEQRKQDKRDKRASVRASRVTELGADASEPSGEAEAQGSKRRDDKQTPSKGVSAEEDARDWVSGPDAEPLLPSQIIANARSRGDLPPAQPPAGEPDDSDYVCDVEGAVRPPAPPAAPDAADDDDNSDDDSDNNYDSDDAAGPGSESDKDGEASTPGESSFKNVDRSLPGPEVVRTGCSVGAGGGGVRLVRIYEYSTAHRFYGAADIPADLSKIKL